MCCNALVNYIHCIHKYTKYSLSTEYDEVKLIRDTLKCIQCSILPKLVKPNIDWRTLMKFYASFGTQIYSISSCLDTKYWNLPNFEMLISRSHHNVVVSSLISYCIYYHMRYPIPILFDQRKTCLSRAKWKETLLTISLDQKRYISLSFFSNYQRCR